MLFFPIKFNVGQMLVGAIVNLKMFLLMIIPIIFKKIKNPGNDVSPFSVPPSSIEKKEVTNI